VTACGPDGVETDRQLARLQEIGCATGQGLLFSPAVDGEHAVLGGVLG
jgi:EAL domain-containing protein (putative c-di-GMP-specific phosphodiesterase class I)